MKVAMVYEEIKKFPDVFSPLIVHTGQHYDYELSGTFFKDLNLPAPDIYLGVGSGNHGEQTAKIMIAFEKVALREKPALIIVVGDVNSTLAASLVASKLLIPLAHVEAGLRSFDRTMPEEINRILTDVVSDYLFSIEESANENLKKEGIDMKKVYLVGDVMVDCLFKNIERAKKSKILKSLGLKEKEYALLTLHRPSNVDIREVLTRILEAVNTVAKRIKIVFPMHLRTKRRIEEFGLLSHTKNLILMGPLSYLDFICLEERAKFVLTDSGGIQEETTVLGVPCLTIRENTERLFTIAKGTNILVGTNKHRIVEESFKITNGDIKRGEVHPLWDGLASKRIVEVLRRSLC